MEFDFHLESDDEERGVDPEPETVARSHLTGLFDIAHINTVAPVAIVTASGVLFIASTDDNRFRALDARNGQELWVTKLERRGNADPITYRGKDGKQYVAVVATDALVVYGLP